MLKIEVTRPNGETVSVEPEFEVVFDRLLYQIETLYQTGTARDGRVNPVILDNIFKSMFHKICRLEAMLKGGPD